MKTKFFGVDRRSALCAATAAGVLSILTSAGAAVNSWTNGTGVWDIPGNWSLGSAPSSSDSADYITNATTKTVTITNVTGSALTISNLVLDAPGGSTNSLLVSTGGSATPLQVFGSAYVGPRGILDVYNSKLQIDGSGFPLRLDGPLWFNGNGGQITVTNGTILVGSTTVIQSNSTTLLARDIWLPYNPVQNGTLTIAGGTVNLSSYLDLGASNNAVGTLWLQSGQLVVTNSSTFVGHVGSGQITVSNGTWLARDVYVGLNAGSKGMLTMAGGTMLVSSNILVGGASTTGGVSTVTIEGGALYVTNAAHNALTEVRYGTLVLTTGAVFATDSLLITNPSGSFINNGGTFTSTGQAQVDQGTQTFASGSTQIGSNLVVGSTAGSTGTVAVTGGQLVVTNGVLGIGNNGAVTNGGGVGQMTVSNGTLLACTILLGSTAGGHGELSIKSGGVVSFAGCTGPDCSITANSLTLSGTGALNMGNGNFYCGRYNPGAMIMSSDGTPAADCLNVFVGDDNLGTLTMASGSMTVRSILSVGVVVGSAGFVWISGGELVAIKPNIITYVGNAGVGQLALSNGILRTSSLRVANLISSVGTLTIAGGTLITDYLTLPNSESHCAFTSGQLTVSQAITNANGRAFTVGDGTDAALLSLGSGTYVFANGLTISANATLITCGGTISGSVVVDEGGTVLADCGGTLTFTGTVNNNGTLRAVNGTTLEFYGAVVNNGLVDVISGNTNFHSTFINNGIVLDAASDWDGDGMSNLQEYLSGTDPMNNASVFRITSVGREGNDARVRWSMGSGKTNALQVTAGVGGSYTNDFTDLFIVTNTVGSVTNYLDVGGATNVPARYYRVRLVP